MKTTTIRALIALCVIVIIGIGFALNTGIGTLSAVGWGDISLLCPLGALGTMLASKTFLPRAAISLVLAIVAIIIFGRAFCGWICPVPLVSKLRQAFGGKGKASEQKAVEQADAKTIKPLTAQEEKALKNACRHKGDTCVEPGAKIDSRHIVLAGSLLSAAIFGFPVFCLICPIGLTFATIFLVMLLFGKGYVTWSLIVVPVLLVLEVVVFRKWCSKICPLSALMSLVAKANKTFKVTIDIDKCLVTSRNATCGKCSDVCEVGIDLHHPELGASWSECTKCRACLDACPTNALSMPFLPTAQKKAEKPVDADRA